MRRRRRSGGSGRGNGLDDKIEVRNQCASCLGRGSARVFAYLAMGKKLANVYISFESSIQRLYQDVIHLHCPSLLDV